MGIDIDCAKDVHGVAALSRAGAADVDALTAKVVKGADATGFGGNEGDDFGVEAEGEAEVVFGLAVPGAEAVEGLVLAVGLGDAEGDGSAEYIINVLHGTAAGGHGDTELAVGGLFDDLFNRTAYGVIDTGLGACAKGNERSVGGAACGEEEKDEYGEKRFHDIERVDPMLKVKCQPGLNF